jgi:1-deoxy-D-xylulose-5-phosphate reductoisomerase
MNLAVLGATGSVGASTLDVATRHPDRYKVFALTANGSADALLKLCHIHKPRYAVLSGLSENRDLRKEFAKENTELLFGMKALDEIAAHTDCRVVMASIVGAAGLPSTLAAARAGKRVLLANKEALVMSGPLVIEAAKRSAAELLPIDSEHNAVFQCFSDRKAVRKIILTASGGPFRIAPLEALAAVTPDQACAHPNWVMGRKISVDSATMMNKGLEVIEARWLFDMPPERIEVLIHPQSIVHSLVEYVDGSMIAQLSNPDMRVPIAHALGYPSRIESGARTLDLAALKSLSFERPDEARFPCLSLAYAALRAGGTAPAVLNAANEIAVAAFLGARLRFNAIAQVIADTLSALPARSAAGLDEILAADDRARRFAAARVLAQAA